MAPDISTYLPLRPVELDILLRLGAGPCHGYGILQSIEERDGPSAAPDIVTLYRALRRMDGQGLVEPVADPEASRRARNRTDYRITDLGADVATAEIRRMEGLILAARRARLAPGGGE